MRTANIVTTDFNPLNDDGGNIKNLGFGRYKLTVPTALLFIGVYAQRV
jgi:hypothetical protein